MARIEQVLARVYVVDLDAALPLYSRLAEGAPVRRFAFGGVELAWVGPFLLLAGTPEELAPFRDRAATVLVDDLDAVAEEIAAAGGEVLEDPAPGPNGRG
ncbi:VOC family protein [Actinomycetospora sp. TBRC 11914]|uniref:VOC family protein n=1 Tax=Actinomycetospora sp. TBRC 11914 TaxID=2729387 RepID=UPI001B7D677C|nr:hypothetical protein [Actinomycetospora sp. TBRC 11914]